MNWLGISRIVLLICAVGAFYFLKGRLTKTPLKGLTFIGVGFGLVMLNLIIGALFHSQLLPEVFSERWFPLVEFFTGYIGQTLGLILLLFGIYRLFQSLLPHVNEHYSSLVEHSLVGVYLIQDGVFKFVNPRLAEIFGYEQEELIGKSNLEVTAPESREIVAENFRKRLDGDKRSIQYEFKGLKKSGEKFDVEVYGSRTLFLGKPAIHGTLLDITERKRAEEALKESEERYRRFFEEDLTGDFLSTPDGKLLDCNPAFARIVGFESVEEALNTDMYSLYENPQDRDEYLKLLKEKRGLENHEGELIRKDGKKICVLYNVSGRFDEHDELVEISGYLFDVTERKRAEEAIKIRARQQAAIAELGQYALKGADMSRLMDKAVKLVAQILDSEYCKVLELLPDGKTLLLRAGLGWKEGLVGKATVPADAHSQASYTLHSDKPVIVEDLRTESRFKGPPLLIDHGIISGMSVIIPGHEQPFGVLSAHTDKKRSFSKEDALFLQAVANVLAEAIVHRQAEKALKESEEKYRSLFEESKDTVYISTPEGKFIDINPAGVELFGYSTKEDILRVDIAHDIYCDERDRVQFQETLKKHGYVKDFELILKRKDGQKLNVLETATVVRDTQGNIVAFQGIIHDLTERKRLEEQLLQAQKMETIGTLAGGVAHDFNNLLTAILGNAELGMQEAKPDHPVYQDLIEIEKAATQASSLIIQLLSFSRHQLLKPKLLNFNSIIQEMLKMLERIIREDIELKIDLAPELPNILADPAKLQQVLMNLFTNARDAMPNGGKLFLKTQVLSADQVLDQPNPGNQSRKYVKLTICDSGIGIDPQNRDRIFDPFFTTKEVGKGTGLGLAVVYGVVKQHNGHIEVKSEVGKGTTFKIYLPAALDEKEVKKEVKVRAAKPRGTETILIAEDEGSVLKVAVRILHGLGYTVLTARDGEEAMQMFEDHYKNLDLVIMDVVMPKGRGPETFEKMQSIKPNLPVLFVTGYDFNAKVADMYRLKQNQVRVLQKPYTAEILGQKVRELLENKEKQP
jgi:PAS domain S-box-containing protein